MTHAKLAGAFGTRSMLAQMRDGERVEAACLRAFAETLRRAREAQSWEPVRDVELVLRDAALAKDPPDGADVER